MDRKFFSAGRVTFLISAALYILLLPALAMALDTDIDGVDDPADNCPAVINAEQIDSDADGMGDGCDISPDWDGPLGYLNGATYKKLFGASVAFAKDINGDGRDEVVVGTPNADHVSLILGVKTIKNVGSVRVYSPAHNNAVLYEFFGDRAGDGFGAAVLGVGDLNSDGYGDFAVGAPGADVIIKPKKSGAGRVVVYSGKDGSILFSRYGDAAGDALGFSMASLGDLDGVVDNGQTHAEILAGAPLATVVKLGTTSKLKKAGKIVVLSGFDGAVLRTAQGTVVGGQMGFSVTGMGDVNGDGRIDFAGGAPYQTVTYITARNKSQKAAAAGAVVFYSGQNGDELERFDVLGGFDAYPQTGAHLGWSIANVGDQDNDGVNDIAIGAPDALGDVGNGLIQKGAGLVQVVRTGGYLLGQFSYGVRGAHVGYRVANGGDINHDNRADIVIGVPYEGTNKAQITADGGAVVAGSVNVMNYSIDLFSSSNETGFMVRDSAGSMRNLYGAALAVGGNVTNKDELDVVIGAPNAGGKSGSVFLWRPIPY